MAVRSLFETPLSEWDYASVAAFLEARVPENETIEYKANFAEHLSATLVSMPNGDGGDVFVGLEEVKGRKSPGRWPLLDPGKDWAGTLYNLAAAETQPKVPIEARAFADPHTGKQIAVAKLRVGSNPPYFARNKGVMVRVGDADVPADPRTLELLFARRELAGATRSAYRHRLGELPHHSFPGNPDQMKLCQLVGPLGGPLPIALNDAASQRVREILYQTLPDVAGRETRGDDWVRFATPSGDALFTLYADARVEYVVGWRDPQGSAERRRIHSIDLFNEQCGLLRTANRLYPQVISYVGDVYAGLALANADERAFAWPQEGVGHNFESRYTATEPLGVWRRDGEAFAVPGPPILFARRMLKDLCWRLGFRGYDAYLDKLGSDRDAEI